ncbi:Rec8 like protein-domain-containing protein [Phellopilus nigrolimitatus]|nr:Rec8 like protein-domain-containing protein [Phellopilus nigrolimitatus]
MQIPGLVLLAMFFSAELLSKRDSGFGLLWLAATLGSKSSFKKLPRRSIQTADISQLCELISHPSEPLALRLSSNLMVGVARVYKIKHEIFVTDVSNCFALLKKAVQEIHALGALSEAQLQMGQPSVRPDALTLTVDPAIAVAFELDAFDTNWADISGIATQRQRAEDDDGEFTPGNKPKSKSKAKLSLILSETGRANLHTLDEHHEHFLSTSFEANGSFIAGIDPSSSQIEPGMNFGSFAFDDNIFGMDDQLDLGIGEIGDDLARELGEGWGVEAPVFADDAPMDVDQQPDFRLEGDTAIGLDGVFDNFNDANYQAIGDDGVAKTPLGRKRPFCDSDKENMPPASAQGSLLTPRSIIDSRGLSPALGALVDAQASENAGADLPELAEGQPVKLNGTSASRKPKKVRILLDARTELTDEELKAAREKYVEGQRAIRLEMERKRLEKEGCKVLDDMIWGVPEGLTAPALTNFWTEIYKIQVESRTGAIHLDNRAAKRRKRAHDSPLVDDDHHTRFDAGETFANDDYAPMGLGGDYDFGAMRDYNAPVNFDDPSRIRSSEEPERGRNAAPRASSLLGFDAEVLNPSSGTQRSAFFPWDNAAGASSSAGAGFAPLGDKGSDRLSLDNADIRIARSRSRSGSRRGSFSIVPSQSGSMIGLNIGLSPGHRSSVIGGEDFRFDVTNDGVTGQDTQETENNFVTLERTSYNFLEYCKMQLQALPGNQSTLDFSDIVPSATSSHRVAAAAFHHCLGTSHNTHPPDRITQKTRD